MCFSAGASFTAASVLVPAGLYCMQVARARDRNFLLLAACPAVFGVQQVCEGLVWVGLRHERPALVRTASLLFLFFALAFWPVWTPLTVWCFEARRRRKRRRLLLAAAGAALIATAIAYVPLLFHSHEWLHVDVAFHSIRYDFEFLLGFTWLPRTFWQIAYVSLVSIPFLLLPQRPLRVFGLMTAVSSIVAQFAFWYAYVSVWCAFAAVLSAWLCWFFHRLPTDAAARPARAAAGLPAAAPP
jgi:uncharacterized protein DUF6629